MDEHTFIVDVLEQLPTCNLGTDLELLFDNRRSLLLAAQHSEVLNRHSPDQYLAYSAMVNHFDTRDHEYLDEIVPNFRRNLRQYRDLQALLIQDLQLMQKALQKELAPFKHYL